VEEGGQMIKSRKILFSSLVFAGLILSSCGVVQEMQELPVEITTATEEGRDAVPDQVLEYTQGEDMLVNIYKSVNPGVVSVI
jgi:hypothetical protein